MTDGNIDLSRRKILAGLGTIGVAGAGAGFGTTALFSDEESFTNNSISAGTLDLHVGWEEHYFDGKNRLDFSGSPLAKSDVDYVEGSPGSGRTTLPLAAGSPRNGATVSVPDQQAALELLDVTEVDEYPSGFDPSDASGDPCNYLEDGSEASPVIVDLDDVKPGDFGEITFSLALCDNPGYLWAQGALQSSKENGTNEPERSAKKESSGTVELLDATRAALWYDNGDNLHSGGGTTSGGSADVVIVADGSGSVTTDSSKFQNLQDGAEALVNAVGSNVNVGFVPFSDSASVEAGLTDSDSTTITAIQNDNNYPGGGTDVGAGITAGQNHLTGSEGDPSANKFLVVLTNGNSSTGRTEATSAKDAGTTIYGIAYGSGADEDLIEDISSTPKNDDGVITSADQYAFDADQTNISSTFSDIGGQVTTGGEEIIVQGTLRSVLSKLDASGSNDYGLPLDGDRSSQFDEDTEPVDDGDRQKFSSGTRHDVGFAWWVPRSVGNQIQSDSATFSLRFYAVQSRNNDGSGSGTGVSAATTTTTTPSAQ